MSSRASLALAEAVAAADASKKIAQDVPEDIANTDVTIRVEEAVLPNGTGNGVGGSRYDIFDQCDFDPKYNIRDTTLQEARVTRKMSELLIDGYIRTPLVVCEMQGRNVTTPAGQPTEAGGNKFIGTCGFLRYNALCRIRAEKPDVWAAKFEGKIPFRVFTNVTEEERIKLLYDHGSEEGLDVVEIMTSMRRLLVQGFNEPQIASIMGKSFVSMASAGVKAEFNKRLEILEKDGVVEVAKMKCKTIGAVVYYTFRRQIQDMKRVIKMPEIARAEWIAFHRKGEGALKLTTKNIELLANCTDEEAALWVATEKALKTRPVGGDGDGDGDGSNGTNRGQSVWGAAGLKSARDAAASKYVRRLFNAALGDPNDQSAIPKMDEDLSLIEKAISGDPDTFWDMVAELSTKTSVPTEA